MLFALVLLLAACRSEVTESVPSTASSHPAAHTKESETATRPVGKGNANDDALFSIRFDGKPMIGSEAVVFDANYTPIRTKTNDQGQLKVTDDATLILIRADGPLLGCVVADPAERQLELQHEDFVRVDVEVELDDDVPATARPWLRVVANGTMADRVSTYPDSVSDLCSSMTISYGELSGFWYVPAGDLIAVTPGAKAHDSDQEVAFPYLWFDTAQQKPVRNAFYINQNRSLVVSVGTEERPSAETGQWDGMDFDEPRTPWVAPSE